MKFEARKIQTRLKRPTTALVSDT